MSANQLLKACDKFWFAQPDYVAAARFRIAFAVVLALNTLFHLTDNQLWFGEFATNSNFLINMIGLQTAHVVLLLASLLLLFGFYSRWVLLLILTVIVAIQACNPNVVGGADHLLRLTAFFLLFSENDVVWSVIPRAPRTSLGTAGLRMVKVQFSLIYIFAFLNKVTYLSWRDGTAVATILDSPYLTLLPLPEALRHLPVFSWGTLFFEGSLPILIWVKRLRPWVITAGVLFHLTIFILMREPTYSILMMCYYIAFTEKNRT